MCQLWRQTGQLIAARRALHECERFRHEGPDVAVHSVAAKLGADAVHDRAALSDRPAVHELTGALRYGVLPA